MNPFELRYSLLSDARNTLFEQWHAAMNLEEIRANAENRAPNAIPAPTAAEIKAYATDLYEFVSKRD